MEKSQTLEDISEDDLPRVQSKRSLDNTPHIYDAELGCSDPSKYVYKGLNTFREIEVDVGTRVRLNEKERHSIRETEGKSAQYSYDGDNWYDFYEGASGEISLTEFTHKEPTPYAPGKEIESDNLAIKGFVIALKTMWVKVKTEYPDYYQFQHVLKIKVKNSPNKGISTEFGSTGTKNPVNMGNTEKNISIIPGQTISFQGGYTAGTHILDVKYILNGKEYSGHTKDHKNFSFGPIGHVGFLDKGYSGYRYSEILGEFIPPYFPPDGKIQLEVLSKYFRKKVSHKLTIEVRDPQFKKIIINNDSSWANIILPKNTAYFYIPAKATGPDHMKVQWYYQAHNRKDWIKIQDNGHPVLSSDPDTKGAIFIGGAQKTLIIMGISNESGKSKDGLKFRAVFSDDVREISKTSQTTTINFSNQLQYAIDPVGYRVVNGKIDSTQEISLPGVNLPEPSYYSHQSEWNLGSRKKSTTPLRKVREIIGTDDRIKVKDPTRFPYRAIGSLELTFKVRNAHGGISVERGYGTAWLVSKDTAVTVAHNLFNPDNKTWAEDIKFYALWENESFQLKAEVKEVWLDKNFLTRDETKYDWAILKLNKPSGKSKHIGEELGWLGYQSHPGIHAYNPQSLSTVYPEKTGIFWLSNNGKVVKSTPHNLSIDLDTVPGTSGAPILIKNKIAIAIFSGVDDLTLVGKENISARITPEIFNVITHVKDR